MEEEKSGGEGEGEAEVEVEVGVTQAGVRINITVGQKGYEKTTVQVYERSMGKRAEEEAMALLIDIATNNTEGTETLRDRSAMEDTVMT